MYPQNYPPNEDRCYILYISRTMASYEYYYISFAAATSRLQVSPSCTEDFVEIRDAHSEPSVKLVRWCGETVAGSARYR